MSKNLMSTSVDTEQSDDLNVVLSNKNTLDTSIFTKGGTYYPQFNEDGTITWTCSDPTYGPITTGSIVPTLRTGTIIEDDTPRPAVDISSEVDEIGTEVIQGAESPFIQYLKWVLPIAEFNETTVTGDEGTDANVVIGDLTIENGKYVLPITFTIPKGDTGEQGEQGEKGESAPERVHYGTSVPSDSVGNDGDLYVQYYTES